MLYFGPPPPKCKHCGLDKGNHKHQTLQCPAKWSRGRTGYTSYVEQTYEPRAVRAKKSPPPAC
jgi:hypothetical protein